MKSAKLIAIEPKTGKLFDGTNLRKEWMKACAALGLGRIIEVEGKPYDPRYAGLTLHDLRRSAVRNLVEKAGVRERVAREITGHKTRSLFDRYHIVSPGDVTRAMQALEAVRLALAARQANGKSVDGEMVRKPMPSVRGERMGKKPSPSARK